MASKKAPSSSLAVVTVERSLKMEWSCGHFSVQHESPDGDSFHLGTSGGDEEVRWDNLRELHQLLTQVLKDVSTRPAGQTGSKAP